MELPFIDWIWRVRGSLPLDPPRSPADAFDKLGPLLRANGTRYEIDGDSLTYTKDNPAAQDKMATFTRGSLQVLQEEGRSKLVYNLTSPALLLCFLAPLLFLGFAQATVILNGLEKPTTEARKDSGADEKDEEKVQPLHPLDVALGAPAPEKPDKKDEKDKKDGDGKHSPTSAYVFAAIFAALYLVGRILEPWLIRSTFRKAFSNAPATDDAEPNNQTEVQQSV